MQIPVVERLLLLKPSQINEFDRDTASKYIGLTRILSGEE